jgi:hypothetical protein
MTQYSRDKQRRFVELLYKKTFERGISWNVNSDSQIYTKIANRHLFIFATINDRGEDLIKFNLFGVEGDLSDTFTDETLRYDSAIPRDFDSWYLLCEALLEMARRQASGADDALDAMLEELDDDVPF